MEIANYAEFKKRDYKATSTYREGYEHFDMVFAAEGEVPKYPGELNPYWSPDTDSEHADNRNLDLFDWQMGFNDRWLEVVPIEDREPYYAKRLRSERTRLGWSRDEMATKGGVPRAYQMLYEKNERIPELLYFINLGMHGADIQMLLLGEKYTTPSDYAVPIARSASVKTVQLLWDLSEASAGKLRSSDIDKTSHVIDVLERNIDEIESLELKLGKRPIDSIFTRRSLLLLATGSLVTYLLTR